MISFGSMRLTSPILAAPMCGISDYPFRQLNREFGVALTSTEMVSCVGVSRGSKKSLSFTFVKNEHPISVQLFGNDPVQMAHAARYFEDQGADAIDINLGCSVRKIAKQGAGAALARDLTLTKKVISAVRASIKVPLFIKCRLGWSKQEETYLALSKIAEGEGVDAICLHPRYSVQLFSGEADWHHFHTLRSVCNIPLIGSGDVTTVEQITTHLTTFPVQAIMLGRALVGNPWLLTDYFGIPKLTPSTILRRHADLLLGYYPEGKACSLLRKYISKYVRNHQNASNIRQLGNQLSCSRDVDQLINLVDV